MEYIGVHSTDDINDGYFGSGVYLRNAIKKHGKNNFSKEIIEEFNDREIALNKERELVNPDYIRNITVYNLVLGGGTPEGRALSNNKFKGCKLIKREYKTDIEGPKLIFYPNEQKVYGYKAWIQLIDWNKEQIFKKQPYFQSGWMFRIIISKYLINHIEEMCNNLTVCYNDKRYNKQALKLIKEMTKRKWLGNYVLFKRMENAA
jgi:hypothetical protein